MEKEKKLIIVAQHPELIDSTFFPLLDKLSKKGIGGEIFDSFTDASQQILERKRNEILAVLCDKQDGGTGYLQLLKDLFGDQIKGILFSGSATIDDVPSGIDIIQKPTRTDRLAEKIAEILNEDTLHPQGKKDVA